MIIEKITTNFTPGVSPAAIAHALRQLADMIEQGALTGFVVVALRGPDNGLVGAAAINWK